MRLFLALALLLASAEAGAQGRTDHHPELGIKITAPFGWTIERKSAYARVITVMSHPDGARLTVAVQPLDRSRKLEAFVHQNRAAMQKAGLKVGATTPRPPGVDVAITSKDAKKRLLQYYVATGELGFVLTLTAPATDIDRYRLAFDYAIKKLELEPEQTGAAEPEPEPETKPQK